MIALYHGQSPINKIVRKLTRSDFGHVSWVFRDGRNAEAVGTGFRITDGPTVGHLPGTDIDVFDVKLDLTRSDHDAIEKFLLSLDGSPYDWAGLLGFVTRKKDQPEDGKHKWFCSEAVAAALILIEKPLLRNLPAFCTSPRDISISPLIKLRGSLRVTGKDQPMNHNYETAIQELQAIQALKTTQIGELIASRRDLDTQFRIDFLKKQVKEIEYAWRQLEALNTPNTKEATNA